MRLHTRISAVIGLGLAAVSSAQGGSQSSVWQGVFTVEQSSRGKAQYDAHCALCHGATLDGSDTVPVLSGGMFVANWDGLSAADLFARIRTTMPANDPGSLSDAVVADVMAYLFAMNRFPAGSTELPKEAQALKQIGISKSAR
jgi:S-disulfanyl-L-cysteine oxidoreductase SoxD